MKIVFNKPYFTGSETRYIERAVQSGKISGNGKFTQKCHDYFSKTYGLNKCLLTTSCTDALEMAAILCEIKPGDEVILPSFTFVSTANAFLRQGAVLKFVDSEKLTPNIDTNKISEVISPRTKAIVPVHYAGIACDMNKIVNTVEGKKIKIVEDAAQAIDSYYFDKPLGSIGDFGCFSFHETKNIISGEGGMISVNNQKCTERSEIIWEKGTNRAAFFRGEVDKYNWVDIGSSFLPSEINAAFLFAQLENLEKIQSRRKEIWQYYHQLLLPLEEQGKIKLPHIPNYATNNAHMFYLLTDGEETRNSLITHLKKKGIWAVFHYLPLHESPYYKSTHDGRSLNNSIRYSKTLLRLPLYFELKLTEIEYIAEQIDMFYNHM